MSEVQKEALAFQALGLLNEQIQARVVHYRGDLETSPELDAVTAQVVSQLKAMQAAVQALPKTREDPDKIEDAHVQQFATLLYRFLDTSTESGVSTQILKSVGRRLAKLFFESELHEKTKGDRDKIIHHAEQGVYYVLSRHKHRIRAELDGFEYVSDEIRELTFTTLAKIERDLQVAFLSRRSPELNRVMTIFTQVLTDFLQKHLPPRAEQMAKVTIRAADTARRPDSVSYKVLPDAFADFREQWERLLMQQMVNFCGDELMAALTGGDETFRDETVRFFTDPHVFSETCEVVCETLYDMLCLEGFLDLPVDWRVSHDQS